MWHFLRARLHWSLRNRLIVASGVPASLFSSCSSDSSPFSNVGSELERGISPIRFFPKKVHDLIFSSIEKRGIRFPQTTLMERTKNISFHNNSYFSFPSTTGKLTFNPSTYKLTGYILTSRDTSWTTMSGSYFLA